MRVKRQDGVRRGVGVALAGTLLLGAVAVGSDVSTADGAGAASRGLTSHVAPDAPAITSDIGGNGEATLTWTTPFAGGSPITGYVITAFLPVPDPSNPTAPVDQQPQVAQQTQTYTTTATTETITSLVNGLDYRFTVAAINADGPGTASLPSGLVITPFAAPSDFVTSIDLHVGTNPAPSPTAVESGAETPAQFVVDAYANSANPAPSVAKVSQDLLGSTPDAATIGQIEHAIITPVNNGLHGFGQDYPNIWTNNTTVWSDSDFVNAIFRMPEFAIHAGVAPANPGLTPPVASSEPGPLRYRDQIFTPGQIPNPTTVQYTNTTTPSDQGTLDVYQPPASDPSRSRPVIVWVHGGSFSIGDSSWDQAQATYFAELGYVAVSINYQLSSNPGPHCPPGPSALWVESIADATCVHDAAKTATQDAYLAVQYLREHAVTYGIDPNRIAIGGESAGGFIATAVGGGALGLPAPDAPGSDRVQAFVSMSGGLPDPDGLAADDTDPTDANSVSPTSAPGYFFSGTADPLAPYSYSVKSFDSLRRNGVDAYLTTWSGSGHVPIQTPQFAQANPGQADPLQEQHWTQYMQNSAAFLYKELDLSGLTAPATPPATTTTTCSDTSGYWIAEANGQVTPFGAAPNFGSLVSLGVTPASPIVGIAATADCKGYWLVASDGGSFAFGDAGFYGSMGGQPLNRPVVGMTSTPQGGYFEVASDGGLFAFGPGATFAGSMGGKPLTRPVVGMAETPQGGYYEGASDGGLFSFGPGAAFAGSMGGQSLNRPVVGMAVNPTGGYYELASDGGIFAFGAPFHGSTGCLSLARPILAMVASPDTGSVGSGTACGFTDPQAPGGYQFVASDGGVFSFGNATYAGSLAGTGVNDVVGLVNS